MTSGPKGVDVSSWQHPNNQPIDWEQVRDDGVIFCIVKATQGDNYTNPWLKKDLEGARKAGLLVGAYHFFETGVSEENQGALFINATAGERLELGAWIDWEPGPMENWQITAAYNALVEKLHEARNPIGLYTTPDWREQFHAANLIVPRWWAADWGVESPPPGCVIWQSGQEVVNGVRAYVDADVLVLSRGFNLNTLPPLDPPGNSVASEGPAVPDPAPAPAPEPEPEPEPHPPIQETDAPGEQQGSVSEPVVPAFSEPQPAQ